MDTQKPYIPQISDSILLTNEAYYKYVFKKTEKIVGVVFYILEHSDKRQQGTVRDALEASAKAAHDAVLATLPHRLHTVSRELYELVAALAALESTLRVAQSAGVVAASAADLLAFEIAGTQRSVRQYLAEDRQSVPAFEASPAAPATRTAPAARQNRVSQRTERGGAPAASRAQHAERRRRIKDILASQGQATIKDISDKMTDCSEKTVQRELGALVQDGEVLKEGERRWSSYTLAPGV